MTLTCRRKGNAEQGFIIVAVLWILGALATLAVIYSLYARTTVLEFLAHDERIQAQALAVSGVELAAYQLTARANERPLSGRFGFQQGSARIGVEFRSENSRLDLNYASKEVLAGLFMAVGVQQPDAVFYADRILAWRTPLPPGTNDPEIGLYQASGKSYGPRHGPFQHVNELGLVASLPAAIVDRVLPYFTVYNGRPEVNVLSASSQVLAALPGLTPERLQLLLTMRENTPLDVVKAQLGLAASYVTMAPGRADRVTVDVQFRSGRRIRSQAVIFILEHDTEPYHVLSWSDEELARGEGGAALQ